MTHTSNALVAHIEALNEATREWVDQDPDNWCVGYLTTDLAHWAEMGVTTVEEFQLYEDVSDYRDLYRAAYGFRPSADSYEWFRNLSTVERYNELQELCQRVS